MPKLRKSFVQQEPQDSQSIGKYISFQQKQTQIPQPINQNQQTQNSQSIPLKNKGVSNKKIKRSLKKAKINHQEEIKANEATAKRKSRRKKVDQQPEKTEAQNDQEKIHLSPKNQKKQKSLRKNKKSAKKNKKNSDQEQIFNDQPEFNNNQLRQKACQDQQFSKNRQPKEDQNSGQGISSSEAVNFNKRLKKKKTVQKQDMNILLSRYTQDQGSVKFGSRITQDDQSNGQIGTRYQSDLRDLDILVKKKQKKQKKEKQITIKNKYFSDISLSQSNEKYEQFQGEDLPQNNQELIFEKRQPRKNIHNLNEVIQKRVNHLKDRREFKSSEGDIKFKNHLRNKLQQVKDVQEVQVDIQVPNLFTKKTASAALYMKNTLQNEQKNAKFSQSNANDQKKLQKTFSNLSANQSQNTMANQQWKKQQFKLQVKKKGVKREDYYNHLNKEIKNKRYTNINSQQIKDCFKTSNLDDQNFDMDLAQDILSNCSSRSASRQSFNRSQRRMSIDSEKSFKNQESNKESNLKKQMNGNSSAGSIGKIASKWSIQMNCQSGQNSNSKSFITNKSSKHVLKFINPSISQVKQSDASSSYKHIDNSRSFVLKPVARMANENSLRFDDQSIKKEVQNSFQQTYKNLDSDNQLYHENDLSQKLEIQKGSQIKTTNQILEVQRQSDKKLQEKLQKIVKNQKKFKSKKIKQKYFDDMLENDASQQNQLGQKKRNKKKQKKNNKKGKNKLQPDNFDQYFEDQAEYSSGEQGHTDQQIQCVDSDLDEQGNIIGFVDKDEDQLQLNERRVKQKFFQDEEKKDKEMIRKIMKGLYGRKKMEPTDSEKRRMKRMQQARQRNFIDDLDEIQANDSNNYAQPQHPNEQIEKIPQKQNQNDQNSMELRKIKEMQQQLAIGRYGKWQSQGLNGIGSSVNEALKLFNPSFPITKTVYPSMIGQSNMGISRKSVDKSKQQRKSIFDTKKGIVQQQIFNKTITDRPRADSTGNRNKLQRTSGICLDIRNKNADNGDDIQI